MSGNSMRGHRVVLENGRWVERSCSQMALKI